MIRCYLLRLFLYRTLTLIEDMEGTIPPLKISHILSLFSEEESIELWIVSLPHSSFFFFIKMSFFVNKKPLLERILYRQRAALHHLQHISTDMETKMSMMVDRLNHMTET
jgi:hypothetical protein